jgi:hypothetical protein
MAASRVINQQSFHDGKLVLYQLENRRHMSTRAMAGELTKTRAKEKKTLPWE